MTRAHTRALTALPIAAALFAGSAAAQSGVEVGTLTCKVTDVSNIVVYTTQTFDCEYESSASGNTEAYNGKITKIGVDLSIKDDFTIIWTVLAPTDVTAQEKALSGVYVGASADVSVIKGVGARMLVGGGENSFTLQPVSVAGVSGTGVALGIERFRLE